jgi:hypothetical protein
MTRPGCEVRVRAGGGEVKLELSCVERWARWDSVQAEGNRVLGQKMKGLWCVSGNRVTGRGGCQ